MPFEVRLNEPIHGYTLDSGLEGQEVRVRFAEFTSSQDGELLVSRLEGIPQQLLSLLPPTARITPSIIDHLVAIIRKDLTATVYVNECDIHITTRAGRDLKAGEAVTHDAIVDIDRLSFKGVAFPADAGVVCLFSSGWRKGFYFDLSPLIPDKPDRTDAREEELHLHSWLLPDKFQRFMKESYFAHFTPGEPAELSRNTVGHGVATPEQFRIL
jgi:hypothetical protein